jgi:hypothetical protein
MQKLSDLGFKWSNVAASKVVNPIPFHDDEAEGSPVKDEGVDDTPVEAYIVDETSKEAHAETREV